MKQEFALDKWGPKRLKVTYAVGLKNAEVFLDGNKIGSFATKEEFQRGAEFTVPNRFTLFVRFGPISGLPLLKGVHVLRDGVPAPGSAADPVPKWAWVFMAMCFAIPVLSLGGALPALIAGLGVSGILYTARMRQWSNAMRAGASALVMVACWGAFALLLASLGKFPATWFMSSSPEKLLQQIEATYTQQGIRPETVRQMIANFRYTCDGMGKDPCVAYLRVSLQKIKNGQYAD